MRFKKENGGVENDGENIFFFKREKNQEKGGIENYGENVFYV